MKEAALKALKNAGDSEKLAKAKLAAEEAKKAFNEAEKDLNIAEERVKVAIAELKTASSKEAEKRAKKELADARESRVEAKKAELEAIDDLKDAQDNKVKAAALEPEKETATAEDTEAAKKQALRDREIAIEKEHKGKLDLENAKNKIDEAKAKMLIREAKQEKIEATLALKRSAKNAIKDEEAAKFKEAEEEGQREIERAEKNLPAEKSEMVAKSKTDSDLKAAKKEALKEEAIAMKKEDLAR